MQKFHISCTLYSTGNCPTWGQQWHQSDSHQGRTTFKKRSFLEEGMWGMWGARVVVSHLRGHLSKDMAVGHHPRPCPALSRLPSLYHSSVFANAMWDHRPGFNLAGHSQWQNGAQTTSASSNLTTFQMWPSTAVLHTQILHITLTSLIRTQLLLQLLPLPGTIMAVWFSLNSPYPWHSWDRVWLLSHLLKEEDFILDACEEEVDLSWWDIAQLSEDER